MDDLELDPIWVVEERGVVALRVVRKLLGSAFGFDSLAEHPLPTPIDGRSRRRLERDVVDTDGVAVIGHRVSVRLLLSQTDPGVLRLQVPDGFTALALELQHTCPPKPSKQLRVEPLAPFDVADHEVEMVNSARLHR
jgi:hypothetical protein